MPELLFVLLFVPYILAANTLVDMSGPGCDQLDGYYLKSPDDLITAYAIPQYNTIATRDHCDVTIRADQGRRIEFLIETINFNECGVEIRMYDNPTIDTNPIHIITCSYNSRVPIQGKTNYNVLRLRVRKTTPESRAFQFRIKMKNDLGPPFDFEKDKAAYLAEILEPGAIAGLAIAGGFVVIALLLVAIFLCVRARGNTKKKQERMYVEASKHQNGPSITVVSNQHITLQKNASAPQGHYSHKDSSKQYSHQESDFNQKDSVDHYKSSTGRAAYKSSDYTNQRSSSARRPVRPKPVVPMPTQPSQRDPDRRGLSDRQRSADHATRPSSQPKRMNRRMETDA